MPNSLNGNFTVFGRLVYGTKTLLSINSTPIFTGNMFHNDITGWIKFFLVGVIEIADKGVSVFDGILQLQNKIAQQLQGLGKRGIALKAVIDFLYTQPVVNYHQIAAITNKSKATNYKIIAELEAMGIIKSMDNAQRNQIWVFEEYVGLFINATSGQHTNK